MSNAGFSKWPTRTLIGLIGGSFILILLLMVLGADDVRDNTGANSYSESALGHKLFFKALEEDDVPVRVERLSPPRDLDVNDLVIFAEPNPWLLPDFDELVTIGRRSAAILVVLPKRSGVADPQKAGELIEVTMDSLWSVNEVLSSFDIPTKARRLTADAEPTWSVNQFLFDPTLSEVQVLDHGQEYEALVSCDEGILLASYWVGGNLVYVLSDPDLIATHGFSKGENAKFVGLMIDHLRPSQGAVVFDEVGHGFEISGSFWQEMFRYPMSLLTFHGLIAMVVLLWVSLGRIGKEKTLPPAIPPGKRFLLDNVVSLMTHYRHQSFIGDKFLQSTIRRTASRLKIRGTNEEIEARLAAISERRSIAWRLPEWRKQLNAASGSNRNRAVLKVMRDVLRWKKEILDGS